MKNNIEHIWSSHYAFLFAAIGAAVGLGNIWRFPYISGANGGGAFILLYVLFVVLLCIPIVAAELFIGRRGRHSPVLSMRKLTEEKRISSYWRIIGWLCISISLLVFSFYSVVAGWSLDYFVKYLFGSINVDSTNSLDTFNALLASPGRLIFWHTFIILLTAIVVALGIKNGLERSLKVLMPGLFIILLLLVGLAAVTADFKSAAIFLFTPDFSKIDTSVALMALGQAFFSVAVGGGALMTYGAYLPQGVSLVKMATIICLTDTLVALLAGLAIFPFVFSHGLSPSEGPGLIFVTLPTAFSQMPGGQPVGTLFFLLLAFAAITTTLALLEPIVAWLEESSKFSRPIIALSVALFIWLLGIGDALSFNVLKEFTPLSFIQPLEDKNLFALSEYTVSNVLLPLNCLLIALFVGWVYTRHIKEADMGFTSKLQSRYWFFSIRYPVPIAIVLAFGLAWYAHH